MTPPPEMPAFDELFKDLSPEEREESKRLIRRYLELVVQITDEYYALTDGEDDRMLTL